MYASIVISDFIPKFKPPKVEEIFEEDSEFSNDDEALAAMEFYDSPEKME